MRRKSERSGLEHQILDRHAGVVKSMPIRFGIILKVQARHGQNQDRRAGGPCAIAFHQASEEPVPLGLMVLIRDDEPPRLLVVGGWCPPGGLEENEEFLCFDRLVGKCAWAPSTLEQVMNGMLRVCRFFHHRLLRLSFLSSKLIFCLQPILVGMAVVTAAFQENLVGAPLDLNLRWPARSRCSFSEDDALHSRCVLFLYRAFRHGCLLRESRESNVGGNYLPCITSSRASWWHRRAWALATRFVRRPPATQRLIELDDRHQIEATGGGE